MEDKKTVKVSLGTVVCIFIIVLLIITLGVVYYMGFVKNNEKVSELEEQTVALQKEINTLNEEKNTAQKQEKETETNTAAEDNSEDSLLTKSEIQSILAPNEATFCIENIEKSGNDYIISATMLENQPRTLSKAEYEDLTNGKEITFRNQEWKMSNSDDYFITIKSGEDYLTVSKDGKTFGNIAGVATALCDYSNQNIKFKVSKDILIGAFWANFKYDINGKIKAYGMEGTDEEDKEVTNFGSLSFERLQEISRGCKGTYDECVAYVKDGVIDAIKVFEK